MRKRKREQEGSRRRKIEEKDGFELGNRVEKQIMFAEESPNVYRVPATSIGWSNLLDCVSRPVTLALIVNQCAGVNRI